MAEQKDTIKDLEALINEISTQVENSRPGYDASLKTVKDFRWLFDQESSKMNQAIFNSQTDQIHESCLKTIAVLVEILART